MTETQTTETSTDYPATPEVKSLSDALAMVLEAQRGRTFFRPDYARFARFARGLRTGRHGVKSDESQARIDAMVTTMAEVFQADSDDHAGDFDAALFVASTAYVPPAAVAAFDGPADDYSTEDDLTADDFGDVE